jgi:hypothetical protein
MTKTRSINANRHLIAPIIITSLLVILLGACKKNDHIPGPHQNHASVHSSEVLDKWMTIQLRLMRNATGVPNHAFSRHFAYSGITALQSLEPGLKGNTHWRNKWNGLTGLPESGNSKLYYYPANVNAAMAAINKAFFPNASAADKAAIDSLENALNEQFRSTEAQSTIDFSSQYGKAVATAVFNWAEADGYKNANAPYTVPTGAGLWKPTAPAFAAPATPYWGNNRNIISGSLNNTMPGATVSYSTDPSSPFYKMVKEVYDVSLTLTDDQKAMAIFWRDVPGVSSPGHWLSILQQAIRIKKNSLDETAFAYALTGTAINDALISCFQAKYEYNLVRPITYIREVMGHETWNAYLGTPAHPEYISAHSSLSAAAAAVLEKTIGNVNEFTDHTYDYMGFAPRTYTSFTAIANEAGLSRLYAGIHYTQSINAGLTQGKKVANNIFK